MWRRDTNFRTRQLEIITAQLTQLPVTPGQQFRRAKKTFPAALWSWSTPNLRMLKCTTCADAMSSARTTAAPLRPGHISPIFVHSRHLNYCSWAKGGCTYRALSVSGRQTAVHTALHRERDTPRPPPTTGETTSHRLNPLRRCRFFERRWNAMDIKSLMCAIRERGLRHQTTFGYLGTYLGT